MGGSAVAVWIGRLLPAIAATALVACGDAASTAGASPLGVGGGEPSSSPVATVASTAAPSPTAAPPTAPPTAAPTAAPARTPAPPPPPTATAVQHRTDTCGAPPNPWGYGFCGGSVIYSYPSTFCEYFSCIPSFGDSSGYLVECKDGEYSNAGGRQGACSHHGGVQRALLEP